MTAGALSPLLSEFQIHTRNAPNALHLFVIRSTALQCSAASVPGNPESRLNIIDHYVQNQYASFRQWVGQAKVCYSPGDRGTRKGGKERSFFSGGPSRSDGKGPFASNPLPGNWSSGLCAILHLWHIAAQSPRHYGEGTLLGKATLLVYFVCLISYSALALLLLRQPIYTQKSPITNFVNHSK